ncbi:MAG: exodeoxyribonuclease VII large subunit, partial [Campylobacter sp.]|nr:exodeoxyribonuclease VII large subunit [Campylobacter sp.]
MTVSELNEQAKTLLETSFSLVEVVGEVSKFTKNATSGHWYFTIKDEKSAVDCAMFKFANSRLKFFPKTGDKVVITGK